VVRDHFQYVHRSGYQRDSSRHPDSRYGLTWNQDRLRLDHDQELTRAARHRLRQVLVNTAARSSLFAAA
jgi:hypothetical protein